MRGQFAPGAEILRRADEAGAEHELPVAVDGDPGREGMVVPQQPAGQGEPIPRRVGRERRKHRRHAPLHQSTRLQEVAPREQVRRPGRVFLPDERPRPAGCDLRPLSAE